MKFEINPTDENILKTIKEDLFHRNQKIVNFLKLLYSIKENTSICLDGDWGTGKTFFVQQCIKTINVINSKSNDLGNFQSIIDANFVNMEDKILPIYYNSWEWDTEEDPLLTIIYDVMKVNNIDIDVTENEKLGEKITSFLEGVQINGNVMYQNAVQIGATIQFPKVKKEDILRKVKFSINIKEKFKELLDMLIIEKYEKIVIFIDELDRCNPKFAVKLLERIKYCLNNDRFIFVFSTNLNELKNVISSYYGSNFNGIYYLQKLFDLQISLNEINVKDYIEYQKIIHSDWLNDMIIKELTEKLQYNIRDCNRLLNSISYIYDYLSKEISGFNEKAYFFVRNVIFIILLCVKFKKYNEYEKMISGNGQGEFLKYINMSESAIRWLDEVREEETLENCINNIYDVLFIKKGDNYYRFGKILIDRDVRKNFQEILSFVNDYIKLE